MAYTLEEGEHAAASQRHTSASSLMFNLVHDELSILNGITGLLKRDSYRI